MKLVEYLDPLKSESQRARILAVMHFLASTQGSDSVSVADIRAALAEARAPGVRNWNIAARLGSAGALVHATGSGGARRWELTESGRKWVAAHLPPVFADTPAVVRRREAATLRETVATIEDREVRAFAGEAVDCLEIGAYRAAVVFMWVAAVHEIQERIWAAAPAADITAAAQSHSPKAKTCRKRDDLTEYNEELLLQVAQDLGVLDKNEKGELGKALQLRNACGHPNKLRPGEYKARAHVEEIITILFDVNSRLEVGGNLGQ